VQRLHEIVNLSVGLRRRGRNVLAFNLLLDRLPGHLGVGAAILLWHAGVTGFLK
jgi:hypothetical protein